MREYKIKKGYHPDINAVVEEYFDVSADVSNGCSFEVKALVRLR